MKKIILIILALFLLFINSTVNAAESVIKKEYKVPAKDGFMIQATLTYPKIKTQHEFKTIVFLHSLGYNSEWWGDLPQRLSDKGFAILTIDLRGHGKSVYSKSLAKVSWKSMTNKAYAKCPDDVIAVIDYIKDDLPKKRFFDDWAIVGADFGANVGIIAADRMDTKPKTIIILSPTVIARGLYVPVSIAQLDNVDFLSITSKDDAFSKDAEKYIRKFSQGGFVSYESQSNTTGVLMLKNDEELSRVITEWIYQYFDVK